MKYNSELNIIESIFSDLVTAEEFEMEAIQCIALAKKKGTKLFFSYDSQATFGMPVVSVYDLHKLHDNEGIERSVRIAVISPISKEGKEVADFYGTVCLNRGWNAKIFSGRDEAFEWLPGK